MTGYEIYDEGYEAGYESAMEDLMEAMEAGKSNPGASPMSRQFKRDISNPVFREGMKQGLHDTLKYKDKKMIMDIRADELHPKTVDKYISERKFGYEDGYYHGKRAVLNRMGRSLNSINGKARIKSKKKANESLFDFDDIDHAYLDDEYDDFDYE